MKRALSLALIGLSVLAATSIPGAAHHSSTMFDHTRTVTIEGVVKTWQLTNPHSWLHVEARTKDGKPAVGKDGKPVVWGFEAEGPSTLQRAGINPSDLKPGTQLTIVGNPMRDGQTAAIWVSAVRSDGKKFNPRAGFQVK